MNLQLHPLSDGDIRAIRAMFESKGYQHLLAAIEAEYNHELLKIKEDLLDLVVEPRADLDRSQLLRPLQLRTALHVLDEFMQDGKEFHSLVIEQ